MQGQELISQNFKNNLKGVVVECILLVLIITFLYSASSKYFDLDIFSVAMRSQSFPNWLATSLILLLPPIEIAIAVLLMFERTKLLGAYISALVLLIFTVYSAMAEFRLFSHSACPCGGLISKMNWKQHLIFNSTLFTMSAVGIYIKKFHARSQVYSGLLPGK